MGVFFSIRFWTFFSIFFSKNLNDYNSFPETLFTCGFRCQNDWRTLFPIIIPPSRDFSSHNLQVFSLVTLLITSWPKKNFFWKRNARKKYFRQKFQKKVFSQKVQKNVLKRFLGILSVTFFIWIFFQFWHFVSFVFLFLLFFSFVFRKHFWHMKWT